MTEVQESIYLTTMNSNSSFFVHEDIMLKKDQARADDNAGNSNRSDVLDSGSAVLSIGFIITIVSLLADIIGYGTWGEFGLLQTIGTIVGIMFVMFGLIIKILANIFS